MNNLICNTLTLKNMLTTKKTILFVAVTLITSCMFAQKEKSKSKISL